jgi:hypothetical protein
MQINKLLLCWEARFIYFAKILLHAGVNNVRRVRHHRNIPT